MDLPSRTTADCFALLDDCDASDADPRSRLYTGVAASLRCHSAAELPAVLREMEDALRLGKHAVGLFSYELGAEMQGIMPRDPVPALAQVLLFDHCERMSAAQVETWLEASMPASQHAGISRITPTISEQEFATAIDRIHAWIEAGDTYQTNYTFRLRFDAYGTPQGLYRRLRQRQPVPYGALIMLPEGEAVLSLSPELFMRHEQGIITARPMKGTAPATGDAQQDAHRAASLAADPKNRAENLMIVDLLRNDLGRVARFGSVRVPKLFSVDRYTSVLQMTSTVQADVREDVGLAEVFGALYPCGSITGAPKRRTMQIIRELEPDARGIYTGAIGWFDAAHAGRRLGDFCLSVPIRTLALQAPQGGVRKGEMGVGAGIVHDSVATDEFAECSLKARFLTGLPQEFELFETMRATHAEGCRHVDLHLNRLGSSAAYFGFAFDEQAIRARVRQSCDTLPAEGAHRMRLALKQDGSISIQTAPMASLATPVKVLLAPDATQSDELFLRHKSSVRERYDAAWRTAESLGAFDMLFFNERGELTEGGRSNVFVKVDGNWFTPPLDAGLLPGVMRSRLLADPAWHAAERSLTRSDLRRAEEIVVCNALRGALAAQIVWDDAAG
ncbi:MAG TPA: aminodeoxychorismate synthase component I [Noviherbaspirillum sp.]|uniref:aminodeoxychorismate synthase component I n=1 Tax=Noviherbaspirillum sp. TaxID=1926288 RepID=UPI002B477867|nr:aminodeoxychorismate synthase component I [Noviherbaspirillum sp.]HJV87208.1 aminodeoxychorismate synthase component I [Noviherbaspirillum sp.]